MQDFDVCGVFLDCGVSTFTSVKHLSTSVQCGGQREETEHRQVKNTEPTNKLLHKKSEGSRREKFQLWNRTESFILKGKTNRTLTGAVWQTHQHVKTSCVCLWAGRRDSQLRAVSTLTRQFEGSDLQRKLTAVRNNQCKQTIQPTDTSQMMSQNTPEIKQVEKQTLVLSELFIERRARGGFTSIRSTNVYRNTSLRHRRSASTQHDRWVL